nr:hypothetical protein [Tanacetum cinerariifolium]
RAASDAGPPRSYETGSFLLPTVFRTADVGWLGADCLGLLMLQRYMHDPLAWRLYDTCGVHHVSSVRGHDIIMLVEKEYPLTKELMTLMLPNKITIPKIADESLKRAAEEELEQESSTRQKTGESSEPIKKEDYELTQEDLQQMVMIVPVKEFYVEALQECWLWLSELADILFSLLPNLLNKPLSFNFYLGDLDPTGYSFCCNTPRGLRQMRAHLDLTKLALFFSQPCFAWQTWAG